MSIWECSKPFQYFILHFVADTDYCISILLLLHQCSIPKCIWLCCFIAVARWDEIGSQSLQMTDTSCVNNFAIGYVADER